MSRTRPARWQLDFIGRISGLTDISGLPLSVIQVYAWMIVCEPPEQSADDLRKALGLSAGAVSSATSTLMRMGMIERITEPGQRRLFYRVRPGAWDRVMQLRLEATAEARATVDEAIARAPSPQPRLAEMRQVYAWFEQRLTDYLGTKQRTPRRQRVKG